MSWMNLYRSKLRTAAEAVRTIESGQQVYYGGNASVPQALVSALAARADELRDVRLIHCLLLGEDPLSRPEFARSFRHNSLFVGPADREAVNDGRADYVPVFIHQVPRLFDEKVVPLDVTMIQVSKPDEHGFMSFGTEVMQARAACRAAKTVIVQVNEKMPRVLGDSFIHVSRVDTIVEWTEPLPALETREPTEVERRIGAHIRGLLEDECTLQTGIGGIPDSVYSMVDGLRDLGIHTEMLSDGAMRAIQKGIVTGNAKRLHPGKAVITFALGSAELYDFLDDNPLIEGHPVDHVNDPYVIGQHDNMVAINSAIEVDLTGQVCSDSIGTRIFSGFGGQVDFIRGAARSKGGKPIIALPSTAKEVSRIVSMLKPGAGVVTSRADVHYVVTEYGVAHLFGRNLRQRAESLIAIAHPDHREELLRQAKARKLLP
jgi:acyl-CoA hydrolase